VRTALLYSPDSAIDGAVLDVILRKAAKIREATGVTVPLPEKQSAIAGALMNAVLLHKGQTRQLSLPLMQDLSLDAETVETVWRNADEGERRSRTRFAQNTIRPAEVLPEWHHWRSLLGTPEEVEIFVGRSLGMLGQPLDAQGANIFLAHLKELPEFVREQLRSQGLEGSVPVVFRPPTSHYRGRPSQLVVRNHPLTATLADSILESALVSEQPEVRDIGRTGAWFTPAVKVATTVLLLRLRFKLSVVASRTTTERLLLVEESETLAFTGTDPLARPALVGDAARQLVAMPANANLADVARDRLIMGSRAFVDAVLPTTLASYAAQRASVLEQDHLRVRASSGGNLPRVTVEAVLPPDVIGFFVLLPASTEGS
jgi:hypothetical protein